MAEHETQLGTEEQEPTSDTERLSAPVFTRGDEQVRLLRSALASPDAMQRIGAACDLDRIERLLLVDVVIAQRAHDENPLDPSAALRLASALRRCVHAGIVVGTARAQFLEQTIRLLARALAALGPPAPPPLVRMLIETARERGREKLAECLERQLAAAAAQAQEGAGRRDAP